MEEFQSHISGGIALIFVSTSRSFYNLVIGDQLGLRSFLLLFIWSCACAIA